MIQPHNDKNLQNQILFPFFLFVVSLSFPPIVIEFVILMVDLKSSAMARYFLQLFFKPKIISKYESETKYWLAQYEPITLFLSMDSGSYLTFVE